MENEFLDRLNRVDNIIMQIFEKYTWSECNEMIQALLKVRERILSESKANNRLNKF